VRVRMRRRRAAAAAAAAYSRTYARPVLAPTMASTMAESVHSPVAAAAAAAKTRIHSKGLRNCRTRTRRREAGASAWDWLGPNNRNRSSAASDDNPSCPDCSAQARSSGLRAQYSRSSYGDGVVSGDCRRSVGRNCITANANAHPVPPRDGQHLHGSNFVLRRVRKNPHLIAGIPGRSTECLQAAWASRLRRRTAMGIAASFGRGGSSLAR
jgi:hypothetical protein